MPDVKTQFSASEPNGAAQSAAKKPARNSRSLMGLGIAAAASIGMLGLISCDLLNGAPPASFQNLGASVSDTTELKGTLKTRLDGNSAQYQLEIEPIHPLDSAGFSYVVTNPPGPFTLHMKLLDTTGNAVCGKDVLFPFHPSSPGEADRERGQDLFLTSVDDSHKITSMNAQGNLPCTADQYKLVASWNFSTDFPAFAEQDRLMRRSPDFKKKQEAQQAREAQKQLEEQELAAQQQQQTAEDNTPRSPFYMEGDERVIKYDAARNVLDTKLGGSFQVTGSEQAAARLWADDRVLFHYKCDHHSDCVLTRAGDGQSLSAMAVQ